MMRQILVAITIAATLAVSSASAFDSADLKKLKETKECRGCDLRRAVLAGANLTFATLPVVTRSKAIGCKPKGCNPTLYNYGRGYPL